MPDAKSHHDKFKGYDKGPPVKFKEYLYGWYPPQKNVYKQCQQKQTSYDLECLYKHGKSRFIDNKHGLKTPQPPQHSYYSPDLDYKRSTTSKSFHRNTQKEMKSKTKNLYVVTYDTPVPGEKLVIHKFGDANDNFGKVNNTSGTLGSDCVDKYSMVVMPPTVRGKSTSRGLKPSSISSTKKSRGIPHKTWSTGVSETDFKVLDYINDPDNNVTTSEVFEDVHDMDAVSEVGSVQSVKTIKSGCSHTSSVMQRLASGRHTQLSQTEATPFQSGRASKVPRAFSKVSKRHMSPVLPHSTNISTSQRYHCDEPRSPTPISYEIYKEAGTDVTHKASSRMTGLTDDLDQFDIAPDILTYGQNDAVCERSFSKSSFDSNSRASSMRKSVPPVNQYTAYQAMYNPVLHTLKWRVGTRNNYKD